MLSRYRSPRSADSQRRHFIQAFLDPQELLKLSSPRSQA